MTDLRTLAYHYGATNGNFAFATLSSSPADISGYWARYKRLIEEEWTPKSRIYVEKHPEAIEDPLNFPMLELGKLIQEGFDELSKQTERFRTEGTIDVSESTSAIAKLETVKRWTELLPDF